MYRPYSFLRQSALMTDTAAVRPHSKLRDAQELVSSMRFAISLLTIICIASAIGTVIKQNEATNTVLNQFGPFWAQVYDTVGLTHIYSAWWFMLILAFLVLSTSLCIARNTPKILHDLRNFKESIREQSLASFHHKGQVSLSQSSEQSFAQVRSWLEANGWKARAQVRSNGTMVAARKGVANKIGYLCAHSAIVLICVGGLFDGDLFLRAIMAMQGKQLWGGGPVQVQNRLGVGTPTFRGNLAVAEGERSSVARIDINGGAILQDLPFDVELKKFIVDYYPTGMPRLFSSEIIIHDHETGAASSATVKVNEPVFHRGVAIYQSSFDDGGSILKLRAVPLQGNAAPFDVFGRVGSTAQIDYEQEKQTIEYTGLRVINVENMSAGAPDNAASATFLGSVKDHLGSGAKPRGDKVMRNIGPSVSYKLVDPSGQRREFNNYMLPVDIDGQRVFLAGMRDTLDEGFRYLRIPADENDSMQGWLRLRNALANAAVRKEAATRYAALAAPNDNPDMRANLQTTAERALGLLAGVENLPSANKQPGQPSVAGLAAMSQFIETTVPQEQRAKVSEVLLRISNGALFELLNLSRERDKLPAMKGDEAAQHFMTQAMLSLSDAAFYPAPILLQLSDFQHVQASVFQVTRSPGKTVVYLGAVLLILGVFVMLYIRERRLWIWIAPQSSASDITLAYSANRRTLESDAEFEQLRTELLKEGHP